jgi:hypothetical protein
MCVIVLSELMGDGNSDLCQDVNEILRVFAGTGGKNHVAVQQEDLDPESDDIVLGSV